MAIWACSVPRAFDTDQHNLTTQISHAFKKGKIGNFGPISACHVVLSRVANPNQIIKNFYFEIMTSRDPKRFLSKNFMGQFFFPPSIHSHLLITN